MKLNVSEYIFTDGHYIFLTFTVHAVSWLERSQATAFIYSSADIDSAMHNQALCSIDLFICWTDADHR